jgi:hypothetical protein
MLLKRRDYWLLAFILFIGMHQALSAQTRYRQAGNSSVTIAGSSTLRDWTMVSKEPRCTATFETDSTGKPLKLLELSFALRSESLKSSYRAMDKNAYSTLNTEEFKSITFVMTSSKINGNKIQCTGDLSIAGVTHAVTFETTYQMLADNTLVCTGSKPMNMTDFEVDPPTFMFGTVQTGDAITVSFKMVLAVRK